MANDDQGDENVVDRVLAVQTEALKEYRRVLERIGEAVQTGAYTPQSWMGDLFDLYGVTLRTWVASCKAVRVEPPVSRPIDPVTVNPPQVGDTTTLEDEQSAPIVIDRARTDGPEVTHFRISRIINGTLYQADGTTGINDGDTITYAQARAGVRFTPGANSTAAGSFDVQSSEDGATVAAQSGVATSTITVTPVGDEPQAVSITTREDTQSGLIKLDRNADDGPEVTHLKISGITGGTLTLADGKTPVAGGAYITLAQGQAGLYFAPSANCTADGSFGVESSEDGVTVADQSRKATSTITVTPVGDTPRATRITTREDTQSGLIVLKRNADDGPEVTHFKISGITGGTLTLNDGKTTVAGGTYITVAQGQAGLRFTPSKNRTAPGRFDVESSEDGVNVADQSGKAPATITVETRRREVDSKKELAEVLAKKVWFDKDRWEASGERNRRSSENRTTLDAIAEILKKHPDQRIVLVGHAHAEEIGGDRTRRKGTGPKNRKQLSKWRSKDVKTRLDKLLGNENQLSLVEEVPAPERGRDEQSIRRVEFRVAR